MNFNIKPFTEDLIPQIKDLNHRLELAGAPSEFRFFNNPNSIWLPKLHGRRIHEELYVLLQDGIARGGYAFKHQEFSFHGTIHGVGLQHWTISEGMIDKAHSAVALQMLRYVMREQPLMYALGMGGFEGGPLPKILKALGWSLSLLPFFFKVNRAGRFLREIRPLRRNIWSKTIMDVAEYTGLGGIALAALQNLKTKQIEPYLAVDRVNRFSGWADVLWEQCHKQYAMVGARDSETLNILYPPDSERFLCYKVTRGSTVLGWTVLLDTQMNNNKYFGNLRVGSIIDCFALPNDASAVIGAVTRVLEGRGVDIIVSNQSHAAWCAAFIHAGFIKGPSNFLFGASQALANLLHPFRSTVTDTHLTRGDGDGPRHL